MRFARIMTENGPVLAVGAGDTHVLRLDRLLPDAPSDPLAFLGAGDDVVGPPIRRLLARLDEPAERQSLLAAGDLVPVDEVDFQVPLASPGKVICLALNYRSHADEGGFTAPSRPVIFLKGPNSLCGHDSEIVVPPVSRRLDHEGELAVVIGRRCRGLKDDDWASAVAGYTIMNDLTARDLQLEDIAQNHPWDFTKSFDTYGPTGPWLVTPDEVPDPQKLDLEVRVNGEVRQSGSTSAMIFGVKEVLVYITSVMTLDQGDIIATGTCDGIGPVEDGATMEVELSGLGTLRNAVRFADDGR